MRRALLLLLALCACASTPERYDYDGPTPRTPSPTYTPAGAGAPMRGQPGAIDPDRATLPPSDSRRLVLPRRDGNAQMSAADGDDARAVRLMLDAPSTPAPEGIAPSAWAKCWEDFKQLARKDKRFTALTHPEAKCLRGLILNHCGARMVEAAESGNEDFLRRHPPQPRTVTSGPRGERTVGTYNQREFEEATSGRRNARECGRNHEYWTERVSELLRAFTQRGDDDLGWRDP